MTWLAITLVVGGAALVALGTLRLVASSFGGMPRSLAAAVVAVGLGVGAFGALLPRVVVDGSPEPTPRVTLEPEQPTDEDVDLRTEIGGTVLDAGGDGLGGVEVSLEVDLGQADERTAVTDADGSFRFTDVPVPGPHRVLATFDGQAFASPRIVAGPGAGEEVEIVVAPTTDDESAISIGAESIAVVGDERSVQVVHALTLSNDGDEAFVGGVPLTLLPGATAIQPGAGLRRDELTLEGDELVSRAPVLPGEVEMTMTYLAQLPRTGLDLEHVARFSTGRFDVLTGEGLATDPATPGSSVEQVELAGRAYQGRSWSDLDAGEAVAATITVDAGPGVLRIALIAAAVVVALAILAFPLLRRRRGPERR